MRLGLILILASSALGQTFDGPAELPRTVPASVAVSLNNPISVPAGGDLQAVVNSATCGDVIQYDPAGILTTSLFSLPSVTTCDSAHWITIDLRGGKVVLVGSNGSIKGGIFVRLANGEITRLGGTGVTYNLIAPGAGAHDLIFDGLYVHGTPTDETVRGLELSNSYNIAVINSHFAEFHCQAISGACGDAQAINGGLDTSVGGYGYLIQNNILEASGENILFGGGTASFVPSDVTIAGNTLYKPDSWNSNDPAYVPVAGKDGLPHPWIVKNLIELKNCRRCLIEHNTLRGSWGGFTQTGFGFLLTPKNPGGCPSCAVEDVTFRFNKVAHTGQAWQIGCGKSDNGFWPAGCGRYSIHDIGLDDMEYPTSLSGDWLMQVSSGYDPINGTPVVLHDVTIDHVSLFQNGYVPKTIHDGGARGFLLLGGPPVNTLGVPLLTNINITNIVTYAGSYPVYSTGGGPNNCVSVVGIADLTKLFSTCLAGNSSVTGNVILTNGNTTTQKQNWPAGNLLLGSGANIN